MRSYQLTYLISPEANKDEVAARMNALIQDEGGVLLFQRETQERDLGYPIAKRKRAFLSCSDFQIGPEKITSLKEKLGSESRVLRYFILVKKLAKTKARSIRRITPRDSQTREAQKVELEEIEKKLEEILDEPK